jgi:hypothetical protein
MMFRFPVYLSLVHEQIRREFAERLSEGHGTPFMCARCSYVRSAGESNSAGRDPFCDRRDPLGTGAKITQVECEAKGT